MNDTNGHSESLVLQLPPLRMYFAVTVTPIAQQLFQLPNGKIGQSPPQAMTQTAQLTHAQVLDIFKAQQQKTNKLDERAAIAKLRDHFMTFAGDDDAQVCQIAPLNLILVKFVPNEHAIMLVGVQPQQATQGDEPLIARM